MLWRPAFFGVRPELVIKGGFIAWAQMGDAERVDPDAAAAASCGRCSAPSGARSGSTSIAFVSQRAALEGGLAALGLAKHIVAGAATAAESASAT